MKSIFITIVLLTLAAIAQAADPQAELNASLNPHGKPKSVGPGKVTEFAVWFADDAWHIRALAVAGSRAYFHGKVQVDGGRIADGSFAGLELGHPKRQVPIGCMSSLTRNRSSSCFARSGAWMA